MSWNLGNNRNPFLKLLSSLGFYQVEYTAPKTSPEKLTITLVEMQQLPDIEETDSQEKISCLNWTIGNGGRKVCKTFKTGTDKLFFVMYRYRNNLYFKDNEVDLKLTDQKSHLAKRVYLLSYIDIFSSGALYWMKQMSIGETKSIKIGCSFSNEHFPIVNGTSNLARKNWHEILWNSGCLDYSELPKNCS